ncbi:transcriptional repressor [Candidatus Acetothermia bacterium]|nr:transcriptional repressor [Candidatus Acetothermia bacterium]
MTTKKTRDAIEVFRRYLKLHNHNITETRDRIVEEIFLMNHHFEVADLWKRLHESTQISSSTVYRTLDLLVAAGLVRVVDLGEAHAHYEHIFGRQDHDHFVCTGCSQVIEFPAIAITNEIEKLAAEKEFEIISRNMQIYGYCRNCTAKNK